VRVRYTLAWVALLGMQSVSASAADAVVRPNQVHQRITGFGASSAWTAGDISDEDADLLFTTGSGVGFSLLRVRIPPGGCSPPAESCEVATALKAQARGASVWAAPWSPPALWKSNGSIDNGGKLLAAHADDWANSLAAYVQWMQGQGVSITRLSAQNEPTTVVSYESCVYTPATLADFIGNHLAPAFAAAKLPTTLVGPETQDWSDLPSFGDAILGNSAAAAALSAVATHSYGKAPPAAYAPAAQAMKELWQTEVYDPSTTPDPGIGSGLRVAVMMQQALVDANVNAWHYWWIRPGAPGNGALWDSVTNAPTKRLYAMGNYSRFVRPGFVRVDTSTTGPTSGVTFSAYVDPQSMKLVIVAINQNASPVSQRFLFDGVTVGSWTSWVTSATEDSTSSGKPVSGSCNPVDAGSEGAAGDGSLPLEGGSDAADDGGGPPDGGSDAADDGGGPAEDGSDAADDGGDAMEGGANPVEGGSDAADSGSDAGEGGSFPVEGGCNASALTVSLEGQSVTTFQGIVTGVGPALPATVSSPAEQSAGGGASGGGGDSTGGSDSSGCACDVARRHDEKAGLGAAMAAVFAVSLARRRRRRGARGCG
jgi:glucuronoarabinoxylan endo-1,4-beta-xylanase